MNQIEDGQWPSPVQNSLNGRNQDENFCESVESSVAHEFTELSFIVLSSQRGVSAS